MTEDSYMSEKGRMSDKNDPEEQLWEYRSPRRRLLENGDADSRRIGPSGGKRTIRGRNEDWREIRLQTDMECCKMLPPSPGFPTTPAKSIGVGNALSLLRSPCKTDRPGGKRGGKSLGLGGKTTSQQVPSKASQPARVRVEKTGAKGASTGRGRKVNPRGHIGAPCRSKMSRVGLTSKSQMKQMDIGVFFGLAPKLEMTTSPGLAPKLEMTRSPGLTPKLEMTTCPGLTPKLEMTTSPSVPMVLNEEQGPHGAEVMDTVQAEGVDEVTAPLEASLSSSRGHLWGGQRRAAKCEPGFPTQVKKPSSRVVRQCPFYKKIPGTRFSVDAFSYGDIPDSSAYFLSHFHSDHYVGLSQRFHHRLYCSQITGNLVNLRLRVPTQFVHTLPMDEPCQVDGVTITLIEANHCPGSVMLLFELPDRTCHLHTGDFRASPAMEHHPSLVGRVIQTLFLDTTYCNPKYEFPPQEQAVDFVVQRCEAAICQDPETLLVIGAYSVGKEKVFLGVAERLGVPVGMGCERVAVMQCLQPNIAVSTTTVLENTCLHVLPMVKLNFKALKEHLNAFKGRFSRVVAFRPTGWTIKGGNPTMDNVYSNVRGKVSLYGIPYSEHSSFSELRRFVQWLRPRRIIPTVNVSNERARRAMMETFRQWQQHVGGRALAL
uniref:uncharacterized protein isoform X1 n=2 Tax=Myxine glutinosa TaxID=7769 RepID=UPI00359028BF